MLSSKKKKRKREEKKLNYDKSIRDKIKGNEKTGRVRLNYYHEWLDHIVPLPLTLLPKK